MKIFLIVLLVLLLPVVGVVGWRVRKDIKKKQAYPHTYAIQNVKTGKDIRVYNASPEDGAKTILYAHNNWECITWEFIQLEGNTYLLKNLYTQKTFQPVADPKPGVGLWQQPLGGSSLQYWEFIKQAEETYLIRLKNTELYLTASSDDNNAPVILMPEDKSPDQRWKLIRQNPVI